MLTINNEADYALLLLSQLHKSEGLVPLSTLIEQTQLPPRFIARIASKMVKGGLLESKEGKIGGYRLKKDWEEVDLYRFLGIFEKNIEVVKCEEKDYTCSFEDICRHKTSLKDQVTKIFYDTLRSWKLRDVVKR